MFFDTQIERLYLIDGLSRSGNHLFIEWIISSFNKGEVYFLNNIYPKNQFDLYDRKKIDIKALITSKAATSDGLDESKSMNPDNIEKLVTKEEMLNLLKGKTKKIKVLIMSIENNLSDILYFFESRFIHAKKIYKIIILRDILNLIASRFEADKKIIVELKKKDPKFAWHSYETDYITSGYWMDNYLKMNDENFIIYNYNKFLLNENYRKELAKKLNINYEKTKIVQSKFLTGSSFKNNDNPDLLKYFTRWTLYKENELINFLSNNNEIKDILCNDFYFCIKDDKLIIKDNIISLIKNQNKTKYKKIKN